jgi:outer membrane murein-binding lipoprotein Lpp
MIRKQHNPVVLIPCAILGISLLAGCATKGYVNKNIEQVRQEHQTDVDGLKTEVAALSNSTQDA